MTSHQPARRQPEGAATLTQLPRELLLHILTFCPNYARRHLRSTCKQLRDVPMITELSLISADWDRSQWVNQLNRSERLAKAWTAVSGAWLEVVSEAPIMAEALRHWTQLVAIEAPLIQDVIVNAAVHCTALQTLTLTHPAGSVPAPAHAADADMAMLHNLTQPRNYQRVPASLQLFAGSRLRTLYLEWPLTNDPEELLGLVWDFRACTVLQQLTNLEALTLRGNAVGDFTEVLAALTQLTYLWLDLTMCPEPHHSVHDPFALLDEHIKLEHKLAMPNLTDLTCSVTQWSEDAVYGMDLDELWSGCTRLTHLEVYSHAGMSMLPDLPMLKDLRVVDLVVNAEMITPCAASQLTYLDIEGFDIALQFDTPLTALQYLHLSMLPADMFLVEVPGRLIHIAPQLTRLSMNMQTVDSPNEGFWNFASGHPNLAYLTAPFDLIFLPAWNAEVLSTLSALTCLKIATCTEDDDTWMSPLTYDRFAPAPQTTWYLHNITNLQVTYPSHEHYRSVTRLCVILHALPALTVVDIPFILYSSNEPLLISNSFVTKLTTALCCLDYLKLLKLVPMVCDTHPHLESQFALDSSVSTPRHLNTFLEGLACIESLKEVVFKDVLVGDHKAYYALHTSGLVAMNKYVDDRVKHVQRFHFTVSWE